MTVDSAVRSRLWRGGELEAEDFPFEKISDYLEQDGALVWVDICDPDSGVLTQLAEELTLHRWRWRTRCRTGSGRRRPGTPRTPS